MCTVEYFDVVFPDGSIERKRRITPCRRGTQHSPCQNLKYDDESYEERQATEAEIRARQDETTGTTHQSDKTSEGSKPKGILRKFFVSKNKARQEPRMSENVSPRSDDGSKKPKADETGKVTADQQNVRRRPRAPKLHNPDEEKEGPSSLHYPEIERRAPSSSPFRDPELDRARWREEERQTRRARLEYENKAAKEQEEAQARAKQHHDEEAEREQRLQDIATASSESKRRKDGRPASYHAIPDEELTDDQMRAQQRQYERDWERIRAFDRLVAKHQEEEDRHAQAETQDRHARRHAEDQERLAWRRQEDGNRRRRQREAGVPRRPRHPAIIDDMRNYDPDDFDQKGSDFLESAIENAERQEAERRAPAVSWNLPVRGRDGLMRRNTTDGSQEEERNGRRRRRKGHERNSRSD